MFGPDYNPNGPLSNRDRLAIELSHKVRGGGVWRRTECPWCIERLGSVDHRGNWCLNIEDGWWHCFRCKVKGRMPGWPSEEFPVWGAPVEEAAPAVQIMEPEGLVSLMSEDIEVRGAQRYMKKRGISKTIAREAKIGACLSGKFADRIIVPVLDTDECTWLGWSGRLFVERQAESDDDDEEQPRRRTFVQPKYRYPEGMPRDRIVYNPAALVRESDEPLLCVEGVFDALPYWPHCIAFLGKPGPKQMPLLKASPRKLVIALDGDSWLEAEMFAQRLAFDMRGDGLTPRVAWVHLPPKQDPNSLDRAWLMAEAKKATCV